MTSGSFRTFPGRNRDFVYASSLIGAVRTFLVFGGFVSSHSNQMIVEAIKTVQIISSRIMSTEMKLVVVEIRCVYYIYNGRVKS